MFYHQIYQIYIVLSHKFWNIDIITGAYAPIEYKVASPLAVAMHQQNGDVTQEFNTLFSSVILVFSRNGSGCATELEVKPQEEMIFLLPLTIELEIKPRPTPVSTWVLMPGVSHIDKPFEAFSSLLWTSRSNENNLKVSRNSHLK